MAKVREGYKLTELGEIPQEWEVKGISDVAQFQSGYAFKSENYQNEGIRLIRIANVQQYSVDWTDECFLPKKFLNEFKEYSLQEDNIVLAMTRPIISTGLKVCKIKARDLPSLLNQRVGRFVLSDRTIRNDYLYQYILSNYFFNKVKELSNTTGQPNISSKQIESITILVPPLIEQQKISSILSSVDEQIEITDHLIEKTKQLKKGLMQRLLTQGIGHERFKDTEVGRIPEEWGCSNVVDLLRDEKGAIKIGPFGSQLKKKYFTKCGYKVYGQENIFKNDFSIGNRYIDEERFNKLKGCELEAGDLVISMMGTVGKTAIVPKKIEKGIMDSHLIRLKVDYKKCHTKLLAYLIGEAELIKKQLQKLSVGGIMDGLSSTIIKKLLLPIPPLKEQQQIAAILSSVDEQIAHYESKKASLQTLKKGLMQQLLTGKTRVKV